MFVAVFPVHASCHVGGKNVFYRPFTKLDSLLKLSSFMESKPIVELHTFRHLADEQVRLSYRYIFRATTICRLSSLV